MAGTPTTAEESVAAVIISGERKAIWPRLLNAMLGPAPLGAARSAAATASLHSCVGKALGADEGGPVSAL